VTVPTVCRFRLLNVKTGAERRFDLFTDAMDELAKLPGEWGAFWSAHSIMKGDHLVDEVWEEVCASPPERESKPPPPRSEPPGSS
jgi:hypothetical protein